MGEAQTQEYDRLVSGTIDPAKWRILSLPMGDGQVWDHEEPRARLVPRDGGLALTVDPFTRKHDHVGIFDNPKHLYASTQTFPLSSEGATVFEAEMAAETYKSNAEDFADGFVAFNVIDFSTGMIFDFISTGRKIGAVYERLLVPGLTDEKTAFTYIVESTCPPLPTSPGQWHRYEIRLRPHERVAEWSVDGRAFFRAHQIPVQLGSITLGFGLFTLKPLDRLRGSISLHGQGATGVWRNLRVRQESR
jgi:hypothetical protein